MGTLQVKRIVESRFFHIGENHDNPIGTVTRVTRQLFFSCIDHILCELDAGRKLAFSVVIVLQCNG